MAKFTIRSWNNTNAAEFADYEAALDAAKVRAAAEGSLVKVRDEEAEEVLSVSADGSFGKWQDDSRYSAKDAMNDAIDAMEDR